MCILHQIVGWVVGVYTSDCRVDGWCVYFIRLQSGWLVCILHRIVEWMVGVYTSDCRVDGWCVYFIRL